MERAERGTFETFAQAAARTKTHCEIYQAVHHERYHDYLFRGRKMIPANADKGEPEAMETKSRCKACGQEWKVRAPV
jgi:hypothetical protein